MLSASAQLVQQALLSQNLETPMVATSLNDEQKRQQIADSMQQIMEVLGLDLSDDSLADTPKRIGKMFVDEIFSGLDYNNFPKMTLIDNKLQSDEMIKVSDISLTSTCEHHFVTIDGMAKLAYIPNKTIIGLSKLNRLVAFFAQRPQIQERLTQQVMVALQALVGTQDVAVSINATHYCVKARGVKDSTSYTQTCALGGVFKSNPHLRAEFFA